MSTIPRVVTNGDKYGPAMRITDQAEADRYFEALVAHSMTWGRTRAEAERLERANLGYWAGYCDRETWERVMRLYKCAHPIFGTKWPTSAEAVAAGFKTAMDCHPVRPAFTLVETLAVIAIIAAIVALSLPALARSREAARLAVCAGNVRTCAVTVQMYHTEQRAVPFANEWQTAPLDLGPVRTCPDLRDVLGEDWHFGYYAGRMLTDWRSGAPWGVRINDPPRASMLWPVTRHYEEFPREWLWCETWAVHAGRMTDARYDGSVEQSGAWRIGEVPMVHP